MSLDIRIRGIGAANGAARTELSLDDDGYYWFLHPWFDTLRKQSGKYLDLYGDAVFDRDDFPRLRKLLDDASAAAQRQPAVWDVCVGEQTHPVPRKIYRSVQRDRLLALLDTFRSMVNQAEGTGQQIECIGD